MTDRDRLLDELVAEREIRQALYRYCHAIDRVDPDELRTIYHPDGVDAHGVFEGNRDEFVEWVYPQMTDATESASHLVGNVKIDLILGDGVAHVESYVMSVSRMRPTENAGPRIRWLGGRYIDRFEKRDGVWRIAHRTFVLDWSQLADEVPAAPAGAFIPGHRSRNDPSYISS